MTLEEIYAIPTDGDGWRTLPNHKRLHIGVHVRSEIDLAKIGSCAEIGSYAKIGSGAKIGSYAEIGSYAKIGSCAKIGSGAEIGSCAEIGSYAKIGSCAEIGSYAKIGSGAKIGSYAKIGSCAKIGSYAKIGSCAEIGANTLWLKSPLAVQGSRHLVTNGTPGILQAGYCSFPFAYWVEHVLEIAEEHGYTKEEGLEYQHIITFMVANGVPAKPDASAALVKYERWAVDDPFLDFLIFMHDMFMHRAMLYNEPPTHVKETRQC
jgi:serine acetyltransferase